jgi:Fe-S oxidoreductase
MKNIPKKQFAGWMLMLLLCISISAFAQSPKKVTGRVMDAQGELLIGVNVTEAADPSNGVVTDINGTYTITLKGNKPSLKFSYIGFKDKVVLSGSCGGMMHHHYRRLFPESPEVADFCDRVFELTEFLARIFISPCSP